MIVKLLTEHHLEFLTLKGGCRGSSESTLVKCQIVGNLMPRLIFKYLIVSSMLIREYWSPVGFEKVHVGIWMSYEEMHLAEEMAHLSC